MKNLILLLLFFYMGIVLHAQTTNNALHFDGVNDYVALPSVATNMNAFTIETWISPNTISGAIAIINTNSWDLTNGGSVHFQFENGNVILSVNGIGGVGWPAMKTKLTTNTWQHIAVTFDKANSLVCFYLNGVLDNSITRALPFAKLSAAEIGAWNNSRYFNGKLDEFRIWNVARSASDIAGSMYRNIANPATTSGLIAYYQFNQGISNGNNTGVNTLTDASASGFNGTLTNFALTGTTSNWVDGKLFLPPSITSYSPISGSVGTTVTITGTNFNTTSTNNIVFFGATKATVNNATATQLIVSVPAGASCQTISVTDKSTGLTAYTSQPFLPTFSCGGAITTGSFASKEDYEVGTNPEKSATSDFDGDGKPDLAITNSGDSTVSILRNTSNTETISFASKVDYTTVKNPRGLACADLDGDGKPDVVVVNQRSKTVSVMRNTSTTGIISFAPKVDYAVGYWPPCVSITDFDGDGKPDLVIANDGSTSISIFRNTCTIGTISFDTRTDYTIGNYPRDLSVGDLDGDGKPDIAAGTSQGFSILRNTSTNGTISFEPKIDYVTDIDVYKISISDLDSDGKPEIMFRASDGKFYAMNNTCTAGTISFASHRQVGTIYHSCCLSIGDLDGDGKPDLAITNNETTVSVLRNTSTTGNILFANNVNYVTGLAPYSVTIVDLNGDGKSEMAITNAGDNTISIVKNLGARPVINSINTVVWSDSVFSITPVDSVNGFVPTGTTYTWGAPTVTGGVTGGTGGSGSSISNTLHNPTSTVQTATYTVNPGCSGSPFTLNVDVTLPPTITTQAASAIGFTTATGNGNIGSLGSPNLTQYGFVWSTSANPTVALSTKTEMGTASATGAFTSTITGLIPNTTYHIKAYATNPGGTIYGNEVTFKTLLAAPPVVTTQAATNILVSTATGNGNITTLGDVNPSQYGVVWSTSPNPTVALTTKTEEGTADKTGAFTSVLTGLNSKTTYFVRAYATSFSSTVYGSEVSFTTLDGSKTVTNNANSGAGSLRNVLSSVSEGDTIVFASDMTITLASQLELGSKSLVIDGRDKKVSISGDNTCRVFYLGGSSGKTFSFNNLTISNGFVPEGFSPTSSGGGLFENLISGILHVSNCTFSNNTATNGGGGVYSGSGGTFLNCTFSNNTARNYGGGVNSSNGAYFSNCTFKENSAAAGGAYAGSNYSFIDCLFNRNTATTYYGGGVYLEGSGTVTNCTFNGNSSQNAGNGAFLASGAGTLTNCIFWNNSSSEIGTYENNMSLNYCALKGGYDGPGAGTGIKTLTINPFAGDTVLTLNKIAGGGLVCIDAGLNSANTKPTDIRGQARIQNTTIDLGAYESTSGVDTESVSGNFWVFDPFTQFTGCFNAFDTLLVAGLGNPVIAYNGTSVTLIAGKSIRLLPGFYAEYGSNVDAYITSDKTFCYEYSGGSSIVELTEEGSNELEKALELSIKTAVKKSFMVYPNPNNGRFTIELKSFEGSSAVCVYNALGKRVYQTVGTDDSRHEITLPEISRGIYLVKVMNGKELLTKRIIVR